MHRTSLKGVKFGSSVSKMHTLCIIGSPDYMGSQQGETKTSTYGWKQMLWQKMLLWHKSVKGSMNCIWIMIFSRLGGC